MAVSFLAAIAIVAATPAMWSADWARLPLPLSSYLSPAAGSLFPLFPWSAYVLVGAGAGQIYTRWGAGHLAAFANWTMVAGGVLGATGAYAAAAALFGSGRWSWVPPEVMVRIGVCLVILGAIAHASRRIARLPHVFGAVAQESLLIYFVHLCIVYGSVWNKGLVHLWGNALAPAATVLVVLPLLGAMVALAWEWNRLKHVLPGTARRVSVAAGVVLAVLLL
jgi:hypothetical protein